MENENKREYKITKSSLGYKVYRTREDGSIEWLQRDNYTKHREYARTFYTISDATSNLVLARTRGKTETTLEEEKEEKAEAQSWSDL